MKKYLLIFFVVSSILFAQENINESKKIEKTQNLYFFTGLDVESWYDQVKNINGNIVAEDTENFAPTFDIQWTINLDSLFDQTRAERLKQTGIDFEIGVGAGYHIHAIPKPYDNFKFPSYNSIPVYFVLRETFKINSDINPYLAINIGYTINELQNNATAKELFSSVEGGLFLSAGFGVEIYDFIIGINLNKYSGKLKYSAGNVNYDYSSIGLSFGYKFSY